MWLKLVPGGLLLRDRHYLLGASSTNEHIETWDTGGETSELKRQLIFYLKD